MSPRIKTKKQASKKQDLEVNQEAVKILRNVSNSEAFHFYENVGKPTGESAKSLLEFLNVVNTIKLESLQFHLERKDFQAWFKETLKDYELAERIESISPANKEKLRTKIHEIVERRLQELRDTFITIEVKEELAIER
jgi:phage anti-repressor protein